MFEYVKKKMLKEVGHIVGRRKMEDGVAQLDKFCFYR